MRTILFLLIMLVVTNVSAADYYISWQPNPEPTILRYVVERSSPDSLSFAPLDSVGATTTEYEDTSVTDGTQYYYRLVAVDSSGVRSLPSNVCGGYSIVATDLPAIKDICRITGVSKVAAGRYRISWTSAEPSIGFVQYSTDNLFELHSAFDSTATTSHSVVVASLVEPTVYNARAAGYVDANLYISEHGTFETYFTRPTTPKRPVVYPVPFSVGSVVRIEGLERGDRVSVYDARGALVWSDRPDGASTEWDGRNVSGVAVASGMYYMQLVGADGVAVEAVPVVVVR